MSTERTLETHAQSEDNYIDIIDIKNHTPVTSPLDTNIEEYTKNAWIYNWGEQKNHPSNPNKFIFECNQKLDNGENCTSKIETFGPTGNIISHLNRKHKIFEHSKPSSTITPSLKYISADLFHRPNMLNFVIQCIIKVKDMQYSDPKKVYTILKNAIQHDYNFGQN
ncbi:hypothetical protein C1646_749176 [Rhizophagus diaphanus]|nr:hypothetical protein C1646_749176 [Rhizophagus diaphanus] [Rhizophagus sp. MUCL 43196]